jgi:putative phosphoribosyl transferase
MKHADFAAGGRALADALAARDDIDGALVLAIVRGGVPLGLEIAARLALDIDLVVLRALFVRDDGGAVRVVRIAGQLSDRELVDHGAAEAGSVEAGFVADALAALAAREVECRGRQAARPIAGRTVILVDNGMRTGGTMAASIHAARALGAARVIAATPVANVITRDRIAGLADALVCLACPEPFVHVGLWYRKFDVPVDAAIAPQLQSFATANGRASG